MLSNGGRATGNKEVPGGELPRAASDLEGRINEGLVGFAESTEGPVGGCGEQRGTWRGTAENKVLPRWSLI